jgi:uncharacterized membrane protein YjjP (DUF1212 family)
MIEQVTAAIGDLQRETANYPQTVQIWMKLMGVSFMASIFFIYSKSGARWILLALILNILGLIVGKIMFPEASRTAIGTAVHMLFWPAILWAVLRSLKQLSLSWEHNTLYDVVYIVWLAWACLLMSISLLFDFRTALSL